MHTLTDNPTRTVADLRHKMSRGGGNLGTPNSVAWMFERKGQIYVDATRYERGHGDGGGARAGAEDFKREDEQYIVTTDPAPCTR